MNQELLLEGAFTPTRGARREANVGACLVGGSPLRELNAGTHWIEEAVYRTASRSSGLYTTLIPGEGKRGARNSPDPLPPPLCRGACLPALGQFSGKQNGPPEVR